MLLPGSLVLCDSTSIPCRLNMLYNVARPPRAESEPLSVSVLIVDDDDGARAREESVCEGKKERKWAGVGQPGGEWLC